MAQIFSIANFKGGVAKTTTAINLGFGLHHSGYKVLLIDLDAQANLTYSMGLTDQLDDSIYDALTGSKKLEDLILQSGGIDFIPSSVRLALAEMELLEDYGRKGSLSILKEALDPVKDAYDFIFIDCMPSIGIITQNALAASDQVIIPLKAEFLPIRGLSVFVQAVDRIRDIGLNPGLKIGGFLVTQYDKRKIMHKDVLALLEGQFDGLVFKTCIRPNIALSEAQSNGLDIFQYDAESNGAKDYFELTKEFKQRFA